MVLSSTLIIARGKTDDKSLLRHDAASPLRLYRVKKDRCYQEYIRRRDPGVLDESAGGLNFNRYLEILPKRCLDYT